nr:F-box/FBD/LRR-repeat protein At1g13570-like [Ipomoea batatas]
MAWRLKAVPDASRDLISQLPLEVKDRILGFLRTPEAARTAMLSKHWNDVWLQHGQLTFDWEFLHSVRKCFEDEGRALVHIINNILFLRAGPIKKFTLQISCDDPTPQQSDVDRWCLFLSRNGVEELKICLDSTEDWEEYKLPFCLLSCRTIKQLIVRGPFIDLPVNDCGIFSNVTSLAFFKVEFKCSKLRCSQGQLESTYGRPSFIGTAGESVQLHQDNEGQTIIHSFAVDQVNIYSAPDGLFDRHAYILRYRNAHIRTDLPDQSSKLSLKYPSFGRKGQISTGKTLVNHNILTAAVLVNSARGEQSFSCLYYSSRKLRETEVCECLGIETLRRAT